MSTRNSLTAKSGAGSPVFLRERHGNLDQDERPKHDHGKLLKPTRAGLPLDVRPGLAKRVGQAKAGKQVERGVEGDHAAPFLSSRTMHLSREPLTILSAAG